MEENKLRNEAEEQVEITVERKLIELYTLQQIDSKIDKNIILDIEDKVTAKPKKYNKENLIEYEVMTRDNRIGEITNVATSIENKYTTNEEIK